MIPDERNIFKQENCSYKRKDETVKRNVRNDT